MGITANPCVGTEIRSTRQVNTKHRTQSTPEGLEPPAATSETTNDTNYANDQWSADAFDSRRRIYLAICVQIAR